MCSRLPWEAILRYIDKKPAGESAGVGPLPSERPRTASAAMISFKSLSAKGAKARVAKIQYKNHPYKLPPILTFSKKV